MGSPELLKDEASKDCVFLLGLLVPEFSIIFSFKLLPGFDSLFAKTTFKKSKFLNYNNLNRWELQLKFSKLTKGSPSEQFKNAAV